MAGTRVVGGEEAVYRKLQVEGEGEWAMKKLMEEGELLDWIESESVGLLSWDVRDEAMDELGLMYNIWGSESCVGGQAGEGGTGG